MKCSVSSVCTATCLLLTMQRNAIAFCKALQPILYLQCSAMCVLCLQCNASSVCTANCLVFAMQCNLFCICSAVQCVFCACNAPCLVSEEQCNVFCVCNAMQCMLCSHCNAMQCTPCLQCSAMCSAFALPPVCCLQCTAMRAVHSLQPRCPLHTICTLLLCMVCSHPQHLRANPSLHRSVCTPACKQPLAHSHTPMFTRASVQSPQTHGQDPLARSQLTAQKPWCKTLDPYANSPCTLMHTPTCTQAKCAKKPPFVDRTPLHTHN